MVCIKLIVILVANAAERHCQLWVVSEPPPPALKVAQAEIVNVVVCRRRL